MSTGVIRSHDSLYTTVELSSRDLGIAMTNSNQPSEGLLGQTLFSDKGSEVYDDFASTVWPYRENIRLTTDCTRQSTAAK